MKRNLLLFFRNRANVFFSLLGALITFALYVIFLKKTFLTIWPAMPHLKQILDSWQIGGTLTVASITTSLTGLAPLVKDRENNIIADLKLTNTSNWQIHLSYVCSSIIISALLQLILFFCMIAYFTITDRFNFMWTKLPAVLALIGLSAILSALINDLIITFVSNSTTLSQLSMIIGTASGFLVGAYLPIGNMPNFAQFLMKITPGTYLAALYRQLFVGNTVSQPLRTQFAKIMGLRVKWNHLLTQQETILIVLLILVSTIILDYLLQTLLPKEA